MLFESIDIADKGVRQLLFLMHCRFRIMSKITTILIGLTLLLSMALGGEWQTTGGQFCIDKCKYHDDGYYFYWCHVSDPTQEYSDGRGSWFNDGNNPSTRLKWDYCVPSELEADDNIIDR